MNKLLYLIVAIVALAAGVLGFSGMNTLEQPESALYYTQAREVKPFTLTDHNGQTFGNQQLQGKWTWVFLGYTSCPDVCPTTLQELNYIYDDLTAIAKNQVLLVSADPQRDTHEKLAQYIAYFNEAFIALRGDHGAIFPFARNMGLMYAITDEENTPKYDDGSPSSYLVDHSASIVLINPEGNIAAIFKPKQVLGEVPSIDGEIMVSDFAKIVALSE